MLASIGFGNPLMPGFWVGKGFIAGEGWAYNLFLERDGRLARKYVIDRIDRIDRAVKFT
jgi:hypothetical protein